MDQKQEKQIQEYLCRPARYANVDGVTEMTAGLTWFGFAMVAWVPSLVSKRSVWPVVVSWVLLYVWFAVLHFGSKAFKKRVTYPRTGFVSYPPAQRRRTRTVAFFVAMAVSAALGFLAVRKHLQLLQPALLIGPCMTLSYYWLARPILPWKWAILALMAAGAVGLVFLPGGSRTQASVGLVFYGAMYVVAGLITLALYLRHSQPAEQVAE
jgi:hypothetical protein